MTIYSQVRDLLVNGHYKPGQRLGANDLGRDFGCSASAIREILFRLSTVGLVDFREQKGFRVPVNSARLQHELTQMRILLECEGASLSIRLGGLDWESRLSAAHHKLGHIESRVRQGPADRDVLILWTAAELEFHQTLIDACGSDLLKRMHGVIYLQFRQQLITKDQDFIFVPENIAQHKGILEAALNHDEALICQLITDHLSRNLRAPLPEPLKTSPQKHVDDATLA